MGVIGPESRRQLRTAARFASVGVELVVASVGGYLLGEWLDTKFGTAPTLSYSGLLIGIAAGFRQFFRLARMAQREADAQGQEDSQDNP